MTRAVIGTLTVAVLAGPAAADFSGAHVEDVSGLVGTPTGLTTFRVFIDFDDPTDQLLAIAGIPGVGAISFSSTAPLFNTPCDPGPCLKHHDFPLFPLSEPYDSYVTIGATTFVTSDTDYTDGFAGSDGVIAVIEGDAWGETDGRWFDADPSTPFTGPSIVAAQLTLDEEASFALSGVAVWRGADGVEMNSAFEASSLPGPGAFSLLIIAGVARRRRRITPARSGSRSSGPAARSGSRPTAPRPR